MKKIILVGSGGIIGILAVAIVVFMLTSPDLGQMPTEAVDSGAVGTDTDPLAETATSTAAPEPTSSAPTEIASASATLLEAQDPPGDWTRDFPEADFTIASVDFGSILSGGPPRDGIPAIDTPSFGTVSDGAKFLADTEPVITLAHGGEAKAYPLSILMYHEIVNDEIGGTPVAVTFCPLCNSTVVFVAEMDGQILDFGTTGRLRYSDLIMYDRQTETWWQQFVGEGIIGTHTGKKLAMLPSRVEAFSVFRDRFPDGKVMLVPTEFQRSYGINPYYEYDQANRDPADRIRPFLFFGKVPDDIAPLAYVIAVGDRAWSLDLLRGQGRLETDDGLIIEWTPGQNAALDQSRIAEGHDIGNVTVQRMQNGALVDVVHDVSFAFAFNAFHPDGEIVQ